MPMAAAAGNRFAELAEYRGLGRFVSARGAISLASTLENIFFEAGTFEHARQTVEQGRLGCEWGAVF